LLPSFLNRGNLMKKIFGMVAILAALSTPAVAQEAPKQTVEGAHRFLKTVAEQHGLAFEFYNPTSDLYGNHVRWTGQHANTAAPVGGTKGFPAMQAMDVVGAKCASTLVGKGWPSGTSERVLDDIKGPRNDNLRLSRHIHFNVHLDEPPKDLTVNWSRVPGINREKHSARITLVKVGRVTAPTVELATRVQYAMEFLRNACDPTASTGF
jgi:hypothetical protein